MAVTRFGILSKAVLTSLACHEIFSHMLFVREKKGKIPVSEREGERERQ